MPAWALGSNVPLMAACDSTYSLDEISQMPAMGCQVLEASVIPGSEYGQPLSMRDLIRYRAIVNAVNVPVVVHPAGYSPRRGGSADLCGR